MKNFEIAVSGMCRRAVIARFRSLDDDDAVPVNLTKDERDAAARLEEEIDAAIEADYDTNRGAEIEFVLNSALEHAAARGVRGPDALAEAAILDPAVLEIINRPGSAAVILRQLIGREIFKAQAEDEDGEPVLATFLSDSELQRHLGETGERDCLISRGREE